MDISCAALKRFCVLRITHLCPARAVVCWHDNKSCAVPEHHKPLRAAREHSCALHDICVPCANIHVPLRNICVLRIHCIHLCVLWLNVCSLRMNMCASRMDIKLRVNHEPRMDACVLRMNICVLRMNFHVPRINIHVLRINIRVPRINIHVPRMKLGVRCVNSCVLRMSNSVPCMNTSMSRMNIHVPHMHARLAPREHVRPCMSIRVPRMNIRVLRIKFRLLSKHSCTARISIHVARMDSRALLMYLCDAHGQSLYRVSASMCLCHSTQIFGCCTNALPLIRMCVLFDMYMSWHESLSNRSCDAYVAHGDGRLTYYCC